MRHQLQRLLLQLGLGNIGEQADVMHDVAALVAQGGNRQQFGIQLAILLAVPYFALPVAEAFQVRPDAREELRRMFIGQEHARFFANDVFAAVAGNFAKGRVDFDDGAGSIHDRNTFMRVAEHACGETEFFLRTATQADLAAQAPVPVENPQQQCQPAAGIQRYRLAGNTGFHAEAVPAADNRVPFRLRDTFQRLVQDSHQLRLAGNHGHPVFAEIGSHAGHFQPGQAAARDFIIGGSGIADIRICLAR